MAYYKHHIFFCLNEREDGAQCCTDYNAHAMFDYMKKKIKSLIFGISGQDGSYLSHFLINKGHDIYGTTRNIRKKNLNNLNKLGVLKKIKIIKCNAKNFKIVKKIIKKNQTSRNILFMWSILCH